MPPPRSAVAAITNRIVSVSVRGVRVLVTGTVLGAAACGGGQLEPTAPAGVTVASLTVSSKSFAPKGPIPIDFSCDGKDSSPELTWSAPPQGTRSLALIVDDPDASPHGFTHWLAFNLPPEITRVGEAADVGALGGVLGVNDFQQTRYNGPCPPHGETHRYVFTVYALDRMLPLHEGADRAAINAAMAEHVLGKGDASAIFGH
jgi:Raf kinase inhibitor-like YbhB/YbcL family protein